MTARSANPLECCNDVLPYRPFQDLRVSWGRILLLGTWLGISFVTYTILFKKFEMLENE